MTLTAFIETKVMIDADAIMEIEAAFKTEEYNKNTLLIKPGSNSQKIFFIEKGLVRTFYFKGDKDVTQFFFEQNTFTAPLNSVLYAKPEPYGWETLEPTILRVIAYKDLSFLLEKYPAFQRFFFFVVIDILNQFSLKLEGLQFQTAEERYKSLLEMHPDILMRASLGHIASCLGITQQTLSVIRGRKSI